MKKIICVLILMSICFTKSFAIDFNASEFGCISDGVTNNTRSIQSAIDLISSKGGGTLNFYVGRYLTGSLSLKSNVTIQLHEGAILLANPSFFDMDVKDGNRYFIHAENQSNIKIIGKGIIMGQAQLILPKIEKQIATGYIPKNDPLTAPNLIGFKECNQLEIDGITLQDAGSNVLVLTNCENVQLKNQIIRSMVNPQSKGIVLNNCKEVSFENLFVETAGKELEKDKLTMIKNNVKSVKSNGKKL